MSADVGQGRSDRKLIESSFREVIDVAFERIDLAEWLFSLPRAEYARCCAPDHLACATSMSGDGQPLSLAVETIGDDVLVQQYVARIHRPDRCELVSVCEVLLPGGDRTRMHVTWTLAIQAVDDTRSAYSNSIVTLATNEFLQYLDRAGAPFVKAAAQQQAATDDHNRRETPGFAASIARHSVGR